MKKIILACGLMAALLAASDSLHAQTAILRGTTREKANASGGISRSCDPSPNICTSNTRNADGTHTVVVYQYDSQGNLTGTVVLKTRSGEAACKEYIPAGYIHDVETTDGILYGKEL